MAEAILKVNVSNQSGFSASFGGIWKTGLSTPPPVDDFCRQIATRSPPRVNLTAAQGLQWDSCLMAAILRISRVCAQHDCQLNIRSMPPEVCRLLDLATAVPVNPGTVEKQTPSWLWLRQTVGWVIDFLRFVGELFLACTRFFSGKSAARFRDITFFFQQSGPSVLGIVTLISILTGMILAYLGTVQLRQFGAEVYVAKLVAIGMVREMGALMTAVIMAGRTGAAYAAQLGTMQVNDEIDALITLGIKPIEYLVIPRMLALVMAMPLLCIYSNALGILGGGLVTTGMDMTLRLYFSQLLGAMTPVDIMTGVFKSLVFGLLIAMAGCQAGMQCGRSSAAVGIATTRAVVTAIVYLVVADAGLNILYYQLGI